MERKRSHNREVEEKINQRSEESAWRGRAGGRAKMIEKTRKYRGCRKVRFSETSPSERLILNRRVIKRK